MRRKGIGRLMWHYLHDVLPAVEQELSIWRCRAWAIPEPELRKQALASLEHKKFHCQGGSVYAAGAGLYTQYVVRFIVALQTISDYLDNLCDRAGVLDGESFRVLHQAMLDAVDDQKGPCSEPGHTLNGGYYSGYPYRDDHGYLQELVHVCRQSLSCLPHIQSVRGELRGLVGLYCDLQVYKHIAVPDRVPELVRWFTQECPDTSLLWQEFAAACGSTLGMFALCRAAAGDETPDSVRLLELYVPWMTGFHILLDYFIDMEEDRISGDLNFVAFYPDLNTAISRMALFYRKAIALVAKQQDPALHAIALHGLPALYLSDVKVRLQGQTPYAKRLMHIGGVQAWGLHGLCRLYRYC